MEGLKQKTLPTLLLLSSLFMTQNALATPDELLIIKEELQWLQSMETPQPPAIVHNHLLHEGMSDKIVLLLRQRLRDWGYYVEPSAHPTYFDTQLTEVVQRFQRHQQLPETGALDQPTRRRLNYSREDRIKRLKHRLNNEASLKIDWNKKNIVVNIPLYELSAFNQEAELDFRSRVAVGREDKPTPQLSAPLKQLKINPDWTPPYSILKEELLPLLGTEQAQLLDQQGFEAITSQDQVIPASRLPAMDLQQFKASGYWFHQKPGPKNALGEIKFDLDNNQSIYLHDTNHRQYYNEPERAFSAGCVRVERHLQLAAWSAETYKEDIQWLIDRGSTHYEPASQMIDIHLVYWLAAIRKGEVVYLDDIYHKLTQD